jgi:hypothetical protein
MKTVIRIFAIVLITITTNCIAQQMVQTTADVYKLKNNEQQFTNKPLKYLLNEVKPEIKMVIATRDYPDYFAFKFLSVDELNFKVIGRKHISFYVYVKEPINWNFDNRPKGNEYSWTKEDAEKYGNLTVVRIKVIERIED